MSNRREAVAKAIKEASDAVDWDALDALAYAGPSWPELMADAALAAIDALPIVDTIDFGPIVDDPPAPGQTADQP